MEKLPALLFALVVVIVTLILGSIFSESIMSWLRLRFNWSRGGEDALLWGATHPDGIFVRSVGDVSAPQAVSQF